LNTHPHEARGFAQNREQNRDLVQRRADALFKKEEQQREGQKAMAEYVKERQAALDKTARLRALRLAHEAEGGSMAETKNRVPDCTRVREGRPAKALFAVAIDDCACRTTADNSR
jgi:4-alpha-glucanotransferase